MEAVVDSAVDSAVDSVVDSVVDSAVDSAASADDFCKKFVKSYNGLSAGMDETNKKALDVMKNKGMDEAIKHMFTDQVSGRQLSYGEMRMRYG